MIVVGFDGSAPAVAALRWAVDEAALRGTQLEVLRAWDLVQELAGVLSDRGMADGVPAESEVAELVQRRLADDVAALLPGGVPDHVRCRAVEAHPVAMLVDASAAADLLVVGPHGRGRVAGLLLGSVTLACVQQASSPVVVVHG
jgi:nucleotide-binding universal stress UspA family protein